MNIFDVFSGRRSIRRYQQQSVELEKIERVLEAARLAPSWKNRQCWRFVVVTARDRRHDLLEAFPDANPGTKAIAGAPVVVVVCADPVESGRENGIDYFIADTAIAFEHLCLAAHALGLGTCWMGWFDEQAIKTALKIPVRFRIVGVTPLGYPDQQPGPRPRKALREIVRYNEWEESSS